MGVEVHFEDIEKTILKELGNSRKQILVAVAWLTNLCSIKKCRGHEFS